MSALLVALGIGGLAFGLVPLAYDVWPSRIRSRSAQAIALAVLLPAAWALVNPPGFTGLWAWDAALAPVSVVALGVAASAADRRVVLAVCGVTLVTNVLGDAEVALAAATVGLAAAVALTQVRMPAIKALAGALCTLAMFEAAWPRPVEARSAVVIVSAGILMASAVLAVERRTRRIAIAAVTTAVAASLAASALFALVALSARTMVDAAVSDVRAAVLAAREGRTAEASDLLSRATASFDEASRKLGQPAAQPARLVPVIGQNVAALDALVSSGGDLARSGIGAVSAADSDSLRIEDGRLDIEAVTALTTELESVAFELERAATNIADHDSPLLVRVIDESVSALRDEAEAALVELETVIEGTRVVPGMFGGDGDRRWFVAMQSNSEARATGGIIGSFGVLTASDGSISFGELGRAGAINSATEREPIELQGLEEYQRLYRAFDPLGTWQNVNLSPDVPTVARVIEQVYPVTGQAEIDGVIMVDPMGLAGLLRLTGPVTVASWPDPITADDAARLLLFDQYLEFRNPDRVDFLGEVVTAVFERLSTMDLPAPAELARVLGPVAAGHHLSVHSTVEREQDFLLDRRLAGAMPAPNGDQLAVFTQNGSGNKIDWFLHRELTYDVDVDLESGVVDAKLDVVLRNEAPASGLPDYVIGGSGANPTATGVNRSIVSVYTPFTLEQATIDGAPVVLDGDRELGRSVFTAAVSIPAGSSRRLTFHLQGTVGSDGYRFHLIAQPVINPDRLSLSVNSVGPAPRWWSPALDWSGTVGSLTTLVEQDVAVTVR